jgi:hypothetical protein
MTNIFSIVADQHQVIITVNSIWLTGFVLIVAGILLVKYISMVIK